jgi:hypothetical protein
LTLPAGIIVLEGFVARETFSATSTLESCGAGVVFVVAGWRVQRGLQIQRRSDLALPGDDGKVVVQPSALRSGHWLFVAGDSNKRPFLADSVI